MSYVKIEGVGLEPAKIRFSYLTETLFNRLDLRTHYRAKMVKDGAGESQLDDVAISQDERDIVLEMLEQAVYEIGAYMFKIAQGVSNSIFFDSKVTRADAVTVINTTPVAGGTGYEADQILTLDDGASGEKCYVKVESVAAETGAVTAVTLLYGGFGYVTGTATTTVNTGSGSGCTVSVTTVADIDTFDDEYSGFELVDNAAYNANLLPIIDKKIEICLIYYCLREWYGTVALPADIQSNGLLYELHLKKLNNATFQLRKPTM